MVLGRRRRRRHYEAGQRTLSLPLPCETFLFTLRNLSRLAVLRAFERTYVHTSVSRERSKSDETGIAWPLFGRFQNANSRERQISPAQWLVDKLVRIH